MYYCYPLITQSSAVLRSLRVLLLHPLHDLQQVWHNLHTGEIFPRLFTFLVTLGARSPDEKGLEPTRLSTLIVAAEWDMGQRSVFLDYSAYQSSSSPTCTVSYALTPKRSQARLKISHEGFSTPSSSLRRTVSS